MKINGSILNYVKNNYKLQDYPIIIVGLYSSSLIPKQHISMFFIPDKNHIYGVTCSTNNRDNRAILKLNPHLFNQLSHYNLINEIDVVFEEFTKQIKNLKSFDEGNTQYIKLIENVKTICCNNSVVFLNVDDIPRKYVTEIFKTIRK